MWKSWAQTHRQCDLCLLEECIPFFSLVLLPCTWQNLSHLPVSFCLSLQDDPRWGWEEAVSVTAPVSLHSGIFLTASADALWNFPGSCDFSWLMWLSNWEEGDEDDRLLKAFKKMLLERIIAHWSHIQPLIRPSKQQYLKALVIFSWLVTTSSWARLTKSQALLTGLILDNDFKAAKESFRFPILLSLPQQHRPWLLQHQYHLIYK